jgi:hypothetical protein
VTHTLEPLVTAAYADRALLGKPEYREAVLKAIAGLDDGTLRIAEKGAAGWTVSAPLAGVSSPAADVAGACFAPGAMRAS